MNCVGCGEVMDPVLAPATTHPNCLVYEAPNAEDPFTSLLKQQLTEIILWYDKQNPRAQQVAIGPSEIGDQCDRRIAYRLAGMPACNTDFDPWAAIVGTALHSWLEKAVSAWKDGHYDEHWYTETSLTDEFVEGHSDLYNSQFQAVIDWKGAGPDVMRKLRTHGPSEGYRIQTHIYGYLFERKGWSVKKVSLVFLPRAGRLRDMYVWAEDYDRSVAEAALARMFGIAQVVMELDLLNESNSHRWEQVPYLPSNSCGFCPWYDPLRDAERGADATGCPGR